MIHLNFAPRANHGTTHPMKEDAHETIDPRLMRRVAEGEVSAFSELYDKLSAPLFSFALRILKDPEEAEELLQEVFVKIWRQAASYDPARGTPFAWAATLIRYKALDRLRSRQRRQRLQDDAEAEACETPAVSTNGTGREAGEEELRSAFTRLPSDQREAIDLAFFGGLTQQEIATRLREPLGTVKARIRRGMLKLRDWLTPTV